MVLLVCCSAHDSTKRSDCLASFKKNRAQFEMCKTQICVLFRTEKPFVFLDPQMTSIEHEHPFSCRRRKQKYPDLSGIFFSILEEISPLEDAMCVWVGPHCTYDNLIGLIDETTNAGPYQFLAGGLLFNLMYRMTNTTIPTVPIVHDKILIVGPSKQDGMNISSALEVVLSPFTPEVWRFLGVCVLCIGLLRVLISFLFGRDRLIRHIFGEYEDDVTPPEVRRFNRYWMNGLALFFAIVILYYEISVVVLFDPEKTSVANINPKSFARIRNTTEDYIFRRIYEKASDDTGHLVDNLDELYSIMMDPKEDYDYTVSYRLFNKYMFSTNSSICKNFRVYDTDIRSPAFDGVWFMSSNIPLDVRTSVNKDIMDLRESGDMFDLVEKTIGIQEPKCGLPLGMNIVVIGLPILLFSGVVYLFLIGFMLFLCGRRVYAWYECRRKRRAQNSRVENGDDPAGNTHEE